MSLLIPLVIGAGVGLAPMAGSYGDAAHFDQAAISAMQVGGNSPTMRQAYLQLAAGPKWLIEPTAGPKSLVEGVRVRSLDDTPAEPSAVDVSLLRYLAARGDKIAAEAEIARLRALNPSWEPPADLYGTGKPVVDVAPLWELYGKQDYAGVREAIARLRSSHPDWQPPDNLLQLMEANEARATLEKAGAAGHWAEIVEAAKAYPQQFNCTQIDNMWRLAEAQARTDLRNEAAETYARIMRSCDDADHRYATLQKASDLLGREAMVALLPLEAAMPKTPEQEKRIEALRAPPKAVAARAADVAPPPRELTELYAKGATVDQAKAAMDLAKSRKDSAAARKIGWLLHDGGLDDEAVEWFSMALAWRSEPDAAKGLATAYAAKGDLAGLQSLGKKWPKIVSPMLENARGAALGVAMERKDWQAVLSQTRDATSTELVLPRGWALTELRRPTEAMMSFQTVLRAADATPAQRDESAYGLVRSYMALELYSDAEGAMQRYGVAPEKVFEVRSELLAKAASEAFANEDYPRVLALLEQRRAVAPPGRGLLMQEAWSRYHTGDLQTAGRIFASQHRLLATKESAAGLKAVEEQLHPNL